MEDILIKAHREVWRSVFPDTSEGHAAITKKFMGGFAEWSDDKSYFQGGAEKKWTRDFETYITTDELMDMYFEHLKNKTNG